MIEVRRLCKGFPTPDGFREILSGLSFSIPRSSFTTIFGPNGCGKSTLVNIIAGLDRSFSGEIVGTQQLKGQVGYVFQDYRRSLLPWYSVEENIIFPLSLRGVPKREAAKKVQELLALTGIQLDLRQPVYSLSGGQAQVVCILRALVIEPRLLILDEPFAAVDYERTVTLRELLSAVSRSLKLSVLFISHDLEEAVMLGDNVIFLSKAPAMVVEILAVNLPYPRSLETTTSVEFMALKQRAVELFDRCCNGTGTARSRALG